VQDDVPVSSAREVEFVNGRLFVFSRVGPMHSSGGMENQIAELLERLCVNWDTTFVTSCVPRDRCRESYGYEVMSCAEGPVGRYSRSLRRFVYQFCEQYKPTPRTIFLNIGSGLAGGFRIARDKEIPVITQLHGTVTMEMASYFKGRRIEDAIRLVWLSTKLPRVAAEVGYANRIVCVSKPVQSSIQREFPWLRNTSRTVVIENGIDPVKFAWSAADRHQRRTELGIDKDLPVLLFLGRLNRQKGWEAAISWFESVREKQECALVVVGGGPDMSRIQLRTRNLPNVVLVGARPAYEVPSWLSMADVLLFPGVRFEGLPMVLLEAACNGIGIASLQRVRKYVAVKEDEERVADGSEVGALIGPLILKMKRHSHHRSSYLPEVYHVNSMSEKYNDLLKDAMVKVGPG